MNITITKSNLAYIHYLFFYFGSLRGINSTGAGENKIDILERFKKQLIKDKKEINVRPEYFFYFYSHLTNCRLLRCYFCESIWNIFEINDSLLQAYFRFENRDSNDGFYISEK